MKNTSPWTANKTWTNLAGKKIPHAHDTNGQQIPEASADVTSLVFPAIGAILILIFGGFLLSSGNSCCHVESGNKKKNEDDSEGIDYTFMDSNYFPKPFPVLQQENNDIVEAVMETYSDLPQYAPISELMASIPGIARQPETRDACVSPIHCIDHVGTFPGNQDDHVGFQDEAQNGHFVNQNDYDNRDVISPDSEDDACDDTEEKRSLMDCTLNIGNDDVVDGHSSSKLNISSGIGTCSRVNTPAISVDSGIQAENMRHTSIPVHLQQIKKALNASFAIGQVEIEKNPLSDSFSHVGELPNKQTTPFTRFTVERWIDDAKESCDLKTVEDNVVPYKWKRPVKLTKQDKLEILRRLQPNLSADNSPCVRSSSQQQTISYTTDQTNVGGYIVNTKAGTKGGRMSCMKVVRAPSSMCIHGNLCHYNCKSSHVTDEKVERNKDDSGRGASCLGVSSRESMATPRGASVFIEPAPETSVLEAITRGASAFDGPTRGAKAFDEDTRGARGFDGDTRGASAFVENDSERHTNHNQKYLQSEPNRQTGGCLDSTENDSNKKACVKQYNKQNERTQQSMDFQGASGFGASYSDCLSFAGTASVTLSMAVQSEREDNTLTSIALKQQTNTPEMNEDHEITNHEELSLATKHEITNAIKTNYEKRSLPTNHRIFNFISELNNEEAKKLECEIAKSDKKCLLPTNLNNSDVKSELTNEETRKPEGSDQLEVVTLKGVDRNVPPPLIIGKTMKTIEAMETKPRDAILTDIKSRGVVSDDVTSRDVRSHNNESFEFISNDKKTLEFDPKRCSTPYPRDARSSINKTVMATDQDKINVKSNNERVEAEDFIESNAPQSTDTRENGPKMSLGKNPHALSGLLKALQREKRTKTGCATEKDCVTENNSVSKNDCVTDDHDEFLKTISKKQTSDKTRSQSPEGSNVSKLERTKHVVGKLKVCLFYNNNKSEKPVLYVTVLKASSLRQEFVQQNEDLYIQMSIDTRDDKTIQTKSVSTFSNTAIFNHLFQVHDITLRELQVSTIKLVLVSGHSQEEAFAKVPLANLVSRDKIKKTYLLKRYSSTQQHEVKKKYSTTQVPVGALHLGLKYNSVDEKLLVNVTKARGLPSMSESGVTDPYVIITVMDDGKVVQEKVTCTKWNQRNPQFDANFVLEVSRKRIGTTSLLLRVMNNSANHSLIGAVKVGMESLENSGRQHWESVVNRDGIHDEKWHKLLK